MKKSESRIKAEEVVELILTHQWKFKIPSELKRTVELTQNLVEACRPRGEEYYRVWYEHLRAAQQSTDLKIKKLLKRSMGKEYAPISDPSKHPFETWNVQASQTFDEACSRELKPGEKAARGEVTIAIKLTRNSFDTLDEVEKRLRLILHWRRMAGLYQDGSAPRPKSDNRLITLAIYQAATMATKQKLRGKAKRDAIRHRVRVQLANLPSALGHEGKEFSDYVGRCARDTKRRILDVASGRPPGN